MVKTCPTSQAPPSRQSHQTPSGLPSFNLQPKQFTLKHNCVVRPANPGTNRISFQPRSGRLHGSTKSPCQSIDQPFPKSEREPFLWFKHWVGVICNSPCKSLQSELFLPSPPWHSMLYYSSIALWCIVCLELLYKYLTTCQLSSCSCFTQSSTWQLSCAGRPSPPSSPPPVVWNGFERSWLSTSHDV